MAVTVNIISEARILSTSSGRRLYVLDGMISDDLDALTAACYSAACRPPKSGGTGGSLKGGPSGPGAGRPVAADVSKLPATGSENGLSSDWGGSTHDVRDQEQRVAAKIEANRVCTEHLAKDKGFQDWCAQNLDRQFTAEELNALPIKRGSDTSLLPGENVSMTLRELVESRWDYKGEGVENYIAAGLARWSIDQWARSSGDHQPRSLAMQLATSEVHGLSMDGLERHVVSSESEGRQIMDEARTYYEDHGDLLRSFVRAEYAATQAYLADRGASQILMRGFAVPEGTLRRTKSGSVRVESNPLSSWSTDFNMAQAYASSRQSRLSSRIPAQAVVLGMRVPNSMIQSTPYTGRGCLNEWEVVVIGRASTARSLSTGSEP